MRLVLEYLVIWLYILLCTLYTAFPQLRNICLQYPVFPLSLHHDIGRQKLCLLPRQYSRFLATTFLRWRYKLRWFIILFIYLFIYKLRQEAWITLRVSSTTRSRKKRGKLVIQVARMTILRKQQKKKWKCKNRIERTSIKNQQHIRSSKLINGRLVWYLIHTLLKVGGGGGGIDIMTDLVRYK